MAKRLEAAHDSKSLGSSVLIWRHLLRIWNQRDLQQLFSYGETSQCCPWQPKPWMICTELKRSASNLRPTISAATISYCEASPCCSWQPKPMTICTDLKRSASIFWFWNVSMLSLKTKNLLSSVLIWKNVCFETETTGFRNNHFLVLKRFSVVHGNRRLWSSVQIWSGLLRTWN